jgi:hypothetical protein
MSGKIKNALIRLLGSHLTRDSRAGMCRGGRDESDLRMLCLERGLEPTGSADQLADRLLQNDIADRLFDRRGLMAQRAETGSREMVIGNKPATCASPFPSEKVATITETDLGTGRIASEEDLIWGALKRHALQTAREGNLARCRNVHLAMANHLLRRNKQPKALQALCIVCVFDLCGVRNRGDAPYGTDKSYSRFDATRASLAPWLVRRIRNLSHEMTLSTEELREVFLGASSRLHVPRNSGKLWEVLRSALKTGSDFD